MSSPTAAGAKSDDRVEARSLLLSLQDVELERYSIIGSCLRFDDRSRNQLKVFRQRLAETFYSHSTAPRNFLLWGAPGSGKSYLVQQAAKSLPPGVRFLELNLTQLDQASLRAGLDDFATTSGPGLCFIDEVDARSDQAWPYEVLLPYLEPPVPRPFPTAFCLAGSGGHDLAELIERIRGRPKGIDLMSRIPRGNEFVVGPLGIGDKVLVSIVQLVLAAQQEGHPVKEIEKLALYYLAAHPEYASARQLRSRAAHTAQRIPPAEDRIRYDYLFRAGDPENKQFWSETAPVHEGLEDTFVRVVSGSVLAHGGTENGASGGASLFPRIAVLPLTNISPDPHDEFFADGLTDELITQVSKISSLRVIARTSVLQYKGSAKSIKDVGHELGVKLALEGSVRKAGNQLRVTVKLVDTASEEQVWSSRYDRPLEDIFAIQDEIAAHIATSISTHLSLQGVAAVVPVVRASAPTRDLEAYALFLQGRKVLAEKGSETTIRSALQLFENAVARDPSFARARVGIAECLEWLATEGAVPFAETIVRTRQELDRALELDPNLAEAHSVLGGFLLGQDDTVGAAREARRAIELSPSLGDPYRWLAQVAAGHGEPDETIRLLQTALQIDPVDVNLMAFLARMYFYTGRTAEALEQWNRNMPLVPFRTHSQMAEYHLARNENEEAALNVREMERLRRPDNVWTEMFRGLLAIRRGDPETARTIIQRLEQRGATGEVTGIYAGGIYLALGEMDRFVACMEDCFRIHQLPLLELLYSPLQSKAREDPRILDLLRRQAELSHPNS